MIGKILPGIAVFVVLAIAIISDGQAPKKHHIIDYPACMIWADGSETCKTDTSDIVCDAPACIEERKRPAQNTMNFYSYEHIPEVRDEIRHLLKEIGNCKPVSQRYPVDMDTTHFESQPLPDHYECKTPMHIVEVYFKDAPHD